MAVRETHGEASWPSVYGWLDCGCWSQHEGCTTHLLRVDVSVAYVPQETVAPAGVTPENLCCALVPVFSKHWRFLRHGAKHDVWTDGERQEPTPRHTDINEKLARAILRRASRRD